jgi:hypothetical protein
MSQTICLLSSLRIIFHCLTSHEDQEVVVQWIENYKENIRTLYSYDLNQCETSNYSAFQIDRSV